MELVAINVAYLLYVLSAAVKTVVRLRIMMIAVSVAFIFWATISGNFWAAAWNVVFGATHGYQLWRIWHRQRSVYISDDEAELHQSLFSDLARLDFLTLRSLGRRWTWPPGSLLIRQGTSPGSVLLVLEGQVAIDQAGLQMATLGGGSFLGERSYLNAEPASATVRAITEAVTLEWQHSQITALEQISPNAYASLMRRIGSDLAGRL